ncbi:MAG: NifU N-terminal domain-containing protein [Acidimicrobiia bacterium]
MTTPNPDAMKFTLDVTLPTRLLAARGDDVDDAFTHAVLAINGVASVFGVNDFVTVTRVHGADWAPILDAVEDAAARHLPSCPPDPSTDAVSQARELLREAARRPSSTAVQIKRRAP